MRLGKLGNMVTIARQITVILLVWGLSFILQKILHIPIASGVLGFFILLLLLHFKGLKLTQVEQGADVLLADLLLFFIPPVVGILQYQQLLWHSGWKIFVVIFISTALVMMASIGTVRLFLDEDVEA